MIQNKYYEFRKWSPVWGIFINQEKEIQKVLNKYNSEGWKVVQFEWNASKLTIFRWILVLLITFLTLGFMSYWTGFSIIFEREEESYS